MEAPENLVPLCPTHHVVAHALLKHRDEIAPGLAPRTRSELVEALRWIELPRARRARKVREQTNVEKARFAQQGRIAAFLRWFADELPQGHDMKPGIHRAGELLEQAAFAVPEWWRDRPKKVLAFLFGEREDDRAA